MGGDMRCVRLIQSNKTEREDLQRSRLLVVNELIEA
jgi:hypothetical protein